MRSSRWHRIPAFRTPAPSPSSRGSTRWSFRDGGRHPNRVEVAALGAAEPGARVLAEVPDVVAALLEDDEPLPERGDPPAALVVDGRRQGEVADRVLAIGVEPERHDDDVA